MKKKLFLCLACFLAVFALVGILSVTSSAATEEYYTYEVSNGEVTITDVYTAISGDVTIPSTLGGYPVTSIGETAFSGCTSLASITIPSSVTSIGWGAFQRCTSLTSIEIPLNVTGIGNYAFESCISLVSITIPSSVTSISYKAFLGCTSLKTVTFAEGSKLESIGSYAFWGCASLTSIEIPSSVTSIGYGAFWDCTSLESITVAKGNTVYHSAGNCLIETESETLVLGCKNSMIPTDCSVTRIGSSAFYGCTSLTSITIPSSVTSIGSYAFDSCDSLASIEIPSSVTSIGGGAFSGCTSLTSISIPEGVTSIDISTFEDSTSLMSISIPKSITKMGYDAFWGCDSLNAVYITDLVAWCNITFLKTVNEFLYYSNPLVKAKNLYLNGKLVTDLVIPDGILEINEGTFSHANCITSVVIPEGVDSIGEYAFYGCDGLLSVSLPDSVINIDNHAFSGCEGLISISLPNSVTNIDQSAFYWCTNLYVVENNSDLKITMGSTDNGNVAEYAKVIIDKDGNKIFADGFSLDWSEEFLIEEYDGSLRLRAYLGEAHLLTLPESIDGRSYRPYHVRGLKNLIVPDGFMSIETDFFQGCTTLKSIRIPSSVTSIGYSAFSGCSSLTSIEIPSSVTSIGYSAFDGCTSLKTVSFAEGSKLESISYDAFYNCDSLTSIEIPDGVTGIGYSAFSGCSSLTSIEIPSSVTSIGGLAFDGCANLESITVDPNNTVYYSEGNCLIETASKALILGCKNSIIPTNGSVTTIGDRAFYDCDSLTSIKIPDSVTYIGRSAFSGCSNLASIEIPDSVTYIGNSAFDGCTSLKTVTFAEGSKLESIGSSAFWDCTSLTSITIPSSVTSIGSGAFLYCKSLTSIEIPSSVTSIGSHAFMGCSSLKTVYITDIAAWCQISFGNTDANPLSNGGKLYLNGELVTNLIFIDTVTRWDTDAFAGYPNFETVYYRGTKEQWNTIAFESDVANPANYGANIIFNARVYTFFDEDGKTVLKTEIVSVGTAIDAPAPTKQATAQYTYTFAGFEGFESGMTIVDDISFVAKYNATVNKYTYTFLDEDGETVLKTLTADYGTVIVAPENPTKVEDAVATYAFGEWQGFESGMTLTEDVAFTAKYIATLKGILSLTGDKIDTAWGFEFTADIKATQVSGQGGCFVLTLDGDVAVYLSYTAAPGVEVTLEGSTFTVVVTRAVEEGESILSVTAKATGNLSAGEHPFLSLEESEVASASFAPLCIYEMGDVNLDGKVNSRDAVLIKQHIVKLVTLSEVQLAYANAYKDENINARDAVLLQQYVVKMPVTLGDRHTLTFEGEGGEEKSFTALRGEDFARIPEPPAGYAWSLSDTEYVAPIFTAIDKSTKYYLVKIA